MESRSITKAKHRVQELSKISAVNGDFTEREDFSGWQLVQSWDSSSAIALPQLTDHCVIGFGEVRKWAKQNVSDRSGEPCASIWGVP